MPCLLHAVAVPKGNDLCSNYEFEVRMNTNFNGMFADICLKFNTSYRVVRKIIVVLKVYYTQTSFRPRPHEDDCKRKR